MESWVARYRKARISVAEARKSLEAEDEYFHERIVEWESDPDRFLLIPSDFRGRIAAEAKYKAAQAELSELLAEKYTELTSS